MRNALSDNLIEEASMVSAIVLLKCVRNQINRVAELLAYIDSTSEVFSVAGQHDLVAILRVSDSEVSEVTPDYNKCGILLRLNIRPVNTATNSLLTELAFITGNKRYFL